MNFKKSITLLLALMLTLALVACGGKETQDGEKNKDKVVESMQTEGKVEQVLRYAANLGPVGSLDIHHSNYRNVREVTSHIQEALLGLDTETLEIVPMLLTKIPEVSEDGVTYLCELKPDIKFHDGTMLTSKDVEFTFERIFNPETKNTNIKACDMILGGIEMLEGKATNLEGFNIIDDTHFEIVTAQPYSTFTSVLAKDQLCIYPEKACKAAGESWGVTTYIGTGPYKVKEFKPKDKVVLEKHKEYHGDAKKLDEIIFLDMDSNTALLEFENGTIDVAGISGTLVDEYLENDKFRDNVKNTATLGTVSFGLNRDMKPFDDVRVREAVNLSIDREALINNYLRGKAVLPKGYIPKGMIGYDEDALELEYNPERAKELLTEAGYPNGIEIMATISESVTLVPVVEVIQEQFKKANIDLSIERVDHATYIDLRDSGKVQIPLAIASFIDTDSAYGSLYGDRTPTNYKNKEFDEMYDEARGIFDVTEMEDMYKKIGHKVIHEDFIVAPLYHPESYYLVSDRVKNAVMMKTSVFRFYDAEVIE